MARTPLSIVRHPLGPRVYVAGLRVHECFAGSGIAAAVVAAALLDGDANRRLLFAVGAASLWLMAKDWPDFFPSRRDTYAWRAGLHRRDDD
ncbi:MAG: hypothetical protein QOG33_647 [Gaiellales bacterium]|jgi:hypothetical protein|nr:hypothetical protein [Gaiellales bacterium]